MTMMMARRAKGRARIPRGTRITGTFPDSVKFAGRTYEVDVFDFHHGFLPVSPYDVDKGVGSVDKVCWIGSGGYWHYADLEDVEVLHRESLPSREPITRQALSEARVEALRGKGEGS